MLKNKEFEVIMHKLHIYKQSIIKQIQQTSNVQLECSIFNLYPPQISSYVRLTLDLGVAISDSGSIKPIAMCSLHFNVSLLPLLNKL